MFIRRFMHSLVAKLLDEKVYLYTSVVNSDFVDILNKEYEYSNYGKDKYT